MKTAVNRFDYLDIAKGVGIIAVVWAHILLVGWSHKVIYSFHMPLFFFISGMLFQRGKYSSFRVFIVKRAERLLLPYLVYSFVTWGIWASYRCFRYGPVDDYWGPLLQTFIAQGSGRFMPHNSALWFIPCLCVVEILFWGLTALKEWQILLGCFALAGISFMCGHIWGGEYWYLLPYNFDAALIALPFYAVGNVLVKHYPLSDLKSIISIHKQKSCGILIIGLFSLIIGALFGGECSMGSSSYQCNGAIFLLRAFIGCFMVILFSLLISMSGTLRALNKILIWFGRNSLDVMCLHIPIKGISIILLARLLHMDEDMFCTSIGLAMIPFAITMVGVTVVISLIKHNHRHEYPDVRH